MIPAQHDYHVLALDSILTKSQQSSLSQAREYLGAPSNVHSEFFKSLLIVLSSRLVMCHNLIVITSIIFIN